MATASTSAFQRALDSVEALPETQREQLIDEVRHRLIETRRDEIAANARKARAEFKAGHCRTGTAAEILKELRSCAG